MLRCSLDLSIGFSFTSQSAWLLDFELWQSWLAALRPGIQVRAPRRICWNEGEVPPLGSGLWEQTGSTWLDGLTFVTLRLPGLPGLRSSRKMWALHRPWIASIAKVCILRVPSSLGRALSPNLCQAPRLKTCGESIKWKITGVANKMLSPDITSWGSSTASTNCAQLPHLPRTPSIVRDVGEGIGAKRSFRLHSLYNLVQLPRLRCVVSQLGGPPWLAAATLQTTRCTSLRGRRWCSSQWWDMTSDESPSWWPTVIYDYMILHDYMIEIWYNHISRRLP